VEELYGREQVVPQGVVLLRERVLCELYVLGRHLESVLASATLYVCDKPDAKC